MTVLERNNVVITGNGSEAIIFAHGYGCDQNMWRYVYPSFKDNYKVILFDHVGAGHSDLNSFSTNKYSNLDGYADDIVEILSELNLENVIFVGHSVSALIGIIASLKSPNLFSKLILVGPSPSYINDGDYIGGFTNEQIDELLDSLDNNHLGWSQQMAPVIMGNQNKQKHKEELTNSFCSTDPEIAKHFARTTFLTDKRDILPQVNKPTLILQCSEDVIAPTEVGEYVHEKIKGSKLVFMNATGHCPNLSAPEETVKEINKFLAE